LSSRSTKAAEKSASSAERAAQAAERAARVAEAGLNIDFDAKLVDDQAELSEGWIVVNCLGARVYVHGVKLQGIFYSDGKLCFLKHDLEVLHPTEGPRLVHRNEEVVLDWPGGRIDYTQPASAAVEIQFSLESEDPPSTIRRTLTFPAHGYQR
jgi:hypothetical protein